MDEPKDATVHFETVFGLDLGARTESSAVTRREIELRASSTNLPVAWTHLSGALPEGMEFDSSGTLSGGGVEAGAFPIELEVREAIGLQAVRPTTAYASPSGGGCRPPRSLSRPSGHHPQPCGRAVIGHLLPPFHIRFLEFS